MTDRGQEQWLDATASVYTPCSGETPTRATAARASLLVHGLGGHTISWEPSAAALAERLHATVTAVDLPGFGLTRIPPGSPRHPRNARPRAPSVTRSSAGPSAVAGNSMGGAIGIGLAARHPDLVRALVLVDPALPRPAMNPAQWTVMARLAPMLLPVVGSQFLAARGRLLGPERLVDDTMGWTLCDPTRLDPELRRRLVELARTRRTFPEAPAAYAESARGLFWYLTRGMRADEARVTSPR